MSQYEFVDSARNASSNPAQELNKLLDKKRQIEQKLGALEKQIYALEESYLTETKQLGNILTGWENYLSARQPTSGGVLKKPPKCRDEDRLFSLSSVTSAAHAAIKEKEAALLAQLPPSPENDFVEEEERPKKIRKQSHGGSNKSRKGEEEELDDL